MANKQKEKALRAAVIEVLKSIYDPELPVDIYALKLIYAIDIEPNKGKVKVTMTLTTPACPVADRGSSGPSRPQPLPSAARHRATCPTPSALVCTTRATQARRPRWPTLCMSAQSSHSSSSTSPAPRPRG